MVDSGSDGAVYIRVAGAVVEAVFPLLDVVVAIVSEVAGAVAACESLGTATAVTSTLVDDVLFFVSWKNSHIAS